MKTKNIANIVREPIRKLVLAWDPDFTKLTPKEKRQVEKAEQSGYIAESDIDWDSIGT